MAYIGKQPVIGNFQKCDAISVVNGQAAYTLQVGGSNVSPQSENHMLVSLNGILQSPTDSFTVSGSTITFASALSTGDVIDFVMILGNVLDLGVPSDNTVSLAKLTATGTKDATTFLRGDNSFQAVSSDYVLLATTTASASASVSFDGYFSDTYKSYKVQFFDISMSARNWIAIRFRRSNADITTSNYINANQQVYQTSSATGTYNNSQWNADKIILVVSSGNSNFTASSEITLFDPLGTNNYKKITALNCGWDATTDWRTSFTGATLHDNTNALSGITLFPASGTFTGLFKLYGIK